MSYARRRDSGAKVFRSATRYQRVSIIDKCRDKFIGELLKTGTYQSQSEVVREGLRLLKDREELKKLRLAELRNEIARGSEEADRGEFVDGARTFAEIRRRGAKPKRVKR